MLKRAKPEIGAWYEDFERGLLFEIVDMDDTTGFIAAQYYDGELEELDRETFFKMPLRAAAQPEDWTGPYELDNEDEDQGESFPTTDNQFEVNQLDLDADKMQIIDNL